MQWTSLAVADQIWHILDVAPQSPADIAGLLPYSDYIIGTPEVILRGESGLYELVQEVGFKFALSIQQLTLHST